LGLWGCLVVSREFGVYWGNLGYIGGCGVVSSCFKLFQVVSRGFKGFDGEMLVGNLLEGWGIKLFISKEMNTFAMLK
jgi:hypothetical protein